MFLLVAPDLEIETLPSITACSMAENISHGIVLHKDAQSAISPSSKCQKSTYTSIVFSSICFTPINVSTDWAARGVNSESNVLSLSSV